MKKEKLLLMAAATMAALIAWSWLAGFLFCALGHLPLHLAGPLTLWRYLPVYARSRPVRLLMHVSATATSILVGLIGGLFFKQRNKPAPYGDARWAGKREVQRSGLLDGTGLIVGRWRGHLLTVPGWEHLMCFAPSGSGKGVGIVIPNLLHWPDSVIVHDVKGENFRLTSGYRASLGQKVYNFNPGHSTGCTHRYNPYSFVSSDPGLRIDDLQKISHLLLTKHDFWENEARTLLVGLSLYLLDNPDVHVSFGNILARTRQSNFYDFVCDVLTRERETMNPVAFMALNAFAQKAEKERSGVLSTLSAALELWANPLIDAATSESDFDLRRFKQERTTLYVSVSPNNLHRLRPLLQILYQQATDILTEKEPDIKTEPYGVLFLMDEFASLGRMTQFEQASAYFRGYRVRFMMVIQDLPQLERHYEKAGLDSFLGMSKVKVTFTSGDYHTADIISRYLGNYGAATQSKSYSVRSSLFRVKDESISEGQTSRSLLLPQEILQLPHDQEIVLLEGMRPILAQKLRYFEEPGFARRLCGSIAVPPILSVIRDLTYADPPAARELTEEEKTKIRQEYGLEEDPDTGVIESSVSNGAN